MRVTVNLDDDVAAEIQRLRRGSDASLKQIVNETLRQGLRQNHAQPKKRKPFRTRPIEGVTPAMQSMDDIAEVLALAEGEFFK